MANNKFKDTPLIIHEPDYGSRLTRVIIELEKLRVKRLAGPVPSYIFFQLKNIFQMFESLGSARIEGNNTTLAEFVEKTIENPSKETSDEKIKEIYNLERAIDFIEKNVARKTVIDRALISEIHQIIVDGLTPGPEGEGSRYPGELRPMNVLIKRSNHIPPDVVKVPEYFHELIDFVNKEVDSQYHLLMVALAHHRMAWIHPFDNGNGRMVRMFTYMLLIKQGFQVHNGRILNPTAIFCMDRDKYYRMLALADTGEKDKVLEWCLYVLEGLLEEIEKIDKLLDLTYMTDRILLPSLSYAFERQNITKREHEILQAVVKSPNMRIKSADLAKVIGQESATNRSRIIKKLKDKAMLMPIGSEKGRIYTISFANNYLLRGISKVLQENKFVPESLNKKQ